MLHRDSLNTSSAVICPSFYQVRCLDTERQHQEETLTKFKATLQSQKNDNQELKQRLEDLEDVEIEIKEWVLEPISGMTFSIEISFSHPKCVEVIAMKFCTWHDSCAKFCSDIIPYNGDTLKLFFHLMWITMVKLFVKWAADLSRPVNSLVPRRCGCQFNTLRLEENGCHFQNDIFSAFSWIEKCSWGSSW